MLVALFVGLIDMLRQQFHRQSAAIPYEILLRLPSLATIAVLAWRREAVRPPAASGVPFVK